MSNDQTELNFKPFADGVSQSMLEELTFENQGDCVSIYGSLQITLDEEGLKRAKTLAKIANEAVAFLEKTDFNDVADTQSTNSDKPKNKAAESEEKPFNWDK